IRKLMYKLIHSTTKLLPAWRKILQVMELTVTNMPRDVSTRWNSTLEMLAYGLKHCKAVNSVTQDHALGLRKFELDNKEWDLLEQLHDVLKILKDATLYFLRGVNGTPNLAAVIPAMDLIDEKLTTYSLDHKYSPAIRAAISLAKQTLNRYYQLTDNSEVYRITMVLHPRHKLSYFK
ncbi:hypothetical protein L210DRAFT_3344234, partial [Boletus edulis BED1]